MKLFSKNFKDYVHVIFGTGFARALAFLCSILVARWLGPEGFGAFSLFFITMVLTWQTASAFDTTYIRYAKATDIQGEKDEYLRVSVLLKTVMSLIVVLFLIVGGDWFSASFLKNSDLSKTLMYGVAAGFFLNFQISVATVLREKEQFAGFTFLNNLHTYLVFLAFLGMYLLRIKPGLHAVVDIYLVASLIVGGVCLIFLIRQIGGFWHVAPRSVAASLSFGKWIVLLTLVFYLFHRMDMFFLTRYLTLRDVGIYSVAIQLTMIISVTTGAVGFVFMPKVINALQSRDALLRYLHDSLVPVVMVILLVLAICIVCPFLVALLYGGTYQESTMAFRILAVGWIFFAIYQPFSFIFYAMDEPRTRFYLELATLIAAGILLAALTPKLGIVGGATAMAAAMAFNALLSFIVLSRKIALHFERGGHAFPSQKKAY